MPPARMMRTRMFSKNPNINLLNNVIILSFLPRKHHKVLSPSILDFPTLVLSPITPLIPNPFNRSHFVNENGAIVVMETVEAAEKKSMKEKGFFLDPSPVSTPHDEKPRLLPFFPTTTTVAMSPELSFNSPERAPAHLRNLQLPQSDPLPINRRLRSVLKGSKIQ
ncbi:hypothetical protein JHK82_024598 [Glycine max]|nr:hypothetical protein JHK86_024704 [Glycine max]KAG5133410.1 hypothetical protein JHK82_024598 [Glycine max]